jgi:hypothetical protein
MWLNKGRLQVKMPYNHSSPISQERDDQRMTPNERQKLIEKLAAETKKLAEPIDFADLEKKGALIKEGAWYRVLNFQILPEHVTTKVRAFSQDSKGVKVKLFKSTQFDKLAREFAKLAK